MAITEEQRYHLFQRLEELLGSEEANTLMEHLPPVGWADVATKTDLDHQRALTGADLDQVRTEFKSDMSQLRTELKSDMDQVRTELKSDMDQLRTELKSDMDQLRTELKGDMDQLRTELKGDMSQLRSGLEARLERGLREQTRTMVLANMGSMAAFASVLLAAVSI